MKADWILNTVSYTRVLTLFSRILFKTYNTDLLFIDGFYVFIIYFDPILGTLYEKMKFSEWREEGLEKKKKYYI